jgi:hypothetical protein
MTLRIFLLTVLDLIIVRTERAPADINLDGLANKIAESGDEDFEGLDEILAPPNEEEDFQGGQMYSLWKDFETVRKDAVKSAQDWSQNTYEAMKEAHQMMAKPIHYAKNALMRDAIRTNEAIRGEFNNHVAMIDSISLDAHARNQIRSEYGQHVLIPPDEFAQDLVGRKVRCNTRYRGEQAPWVHEHPLGEIVGFETGSDAYRIALDKAQWKASEHAPPEREFYLLHKGEFALLPDNGRDLGDGRLLDFSAAAANGKAASMEERGFYQLHPYVVVDSSPGNGTAPSWRDVPVAVKDDWASVLRNNRICKVVRVNEEDGTFVIAHADGNASLDTPYDERRYEEAVEKTVNLKAGLDFHTFSSVKGDKVKFSVEDYLGGNTSVRNVEGRVVSFDPGKMSYTISVPEFEVPIGDAKRMNTSEKDWHKKGSSTPSKFDKPRVGKRVMMRHGKDWVMGTILDFQEPTSHSPPASLKDYTYDLLSDGGEQVRGRWPDDWRDPAGFTQTHQAKERTLASVEAHDGHAAAIRSLEAAHIEGT